MSYLISSDTSIRNIKSPLKYWNIFPGWLDHVFFIFISNSFYNS